MYEEIVKKNRETLKKQLKRNIQDEEYIILLTRIYKNVSCKNPTSINDRVYDFLELYYPELTIKLSREKITKIIHEKKTFKRKYLSNKWVREESVGFELKQDQLSFLDEILPYFNTKLKWKRRTKNFLIKKLREEIDKYIKLKFPRTREYLQDSLLCALLLEKAKSTKNLVFKSSNFIQMLGSEISFFNNYKPKHGLIYNYETVKNAENKGKTARILANKLSLLLKEDYFK